MSLPHPDKNLIDRYLNGELSGIELENFREKMQGDDYFKNEVNFQNLIRSGILFSKEEELKKKILDSIKFRKPRIPFALKHIVAFLLITVLGITLWFYVGMDSSNSNISHSFFSFTSKEKEKKTEKKITGTADEKNNDEGSDSQSANENGQAVVREETPAGENVSGSTGIKQEQQNQTAANDSASPVKDEDENIVIKKEKLLITATIPVIEKPTQDIKSADAAQNSTLTHDAVEKLNPSAGVPEEEKAALNYLVEFWVSPINYRGYKMSKNKLIIYGIEEPDAVKLYRWNDVVFMKYGNEFFRLVNTFDYIPYQRLKESDVPLAIRQ